MTSSFPPPFDDLAAVPSALGTRGYAVLSAAATARIAGVALPALTTLEPSWNDLPADPYLKDGGRYRRRRHTSYRVDGATVAQVPQRAHWQPLEYNALHGGMQRWFEPVAPAVAASPGWLGLIEGIGALCSALRPDAPWFVEAHQFRIDTADGIGRPTPEGAHRDGVDFVAVLLVDRRDVKGGETRVFAASGPDGRRFTMETPWTLLLLDDAKVIHESTPIQPAGEVSRDGYRDTLVLTYRTGGFQGDAEAAMT